METPTKCELLPSYREYKIKARRLNIWDVAGFFESITRFIGFHPIYFRELNFRPQTYEFQAENVSAFSKL